MTVFYSKTTNGFHHVNDGLENIPNDGVEISREYWRELLNGQAIGKVISFNDDGYPVLSEHLAPPPLSYDVLRSIEYPPMTDYIDGVVKGDQAQIDAYIAACQAVKAKYPKP